MDNQLRCRQQVGRLLSEGEVLAITEKVMVDNIVTGGKPTTPSRRKDQYSKGLILHEVPTTSGPDGPPPSAWPLVRMWLASCPDLLRPLLRRDFLQITDHLRAAAPETAAIRAMQQFWKELGDAAGIVEAKLRTELEEKRRAATGVGCSWVKCVMYEQEERVGETFRCAGCRDAMYCRLDCQKRSAFPHARSRLSQTADPRQSTRTFTGTLPTCMLQTLAGRWSQRGMRRHRQSGNIGFRNLGQDGLGLEAQSKCSTR